MAFEIVGMSAEDRLAWQEALLGLVTETVDISSAEIKALIASPKQIIAAPGAGYYIDLQSYRMEYHYGGVAYTRNVFLYLTLDNSNNQATLVAVNDIFAGSADKISFSAAVNMHINGDGYLLRSRAENKPLLLAGSGNFGELIDGNGTAKLTVSYIVRPFLF